MIDHKQVPYFKLTPAQKSDRPSINQILTQDDASFWIKGAIKALMKCDPCDAVYEAELLAMLMRDRCDKIFAQHEQGEI